MTLHAGTRLGPYEIAAGLGAGGMGEVYRAVDTRLGREVAIKVLPAHWAGDAAMQARFRQEAQTIASLNHPHICALHDIGTERPAAGADPVTFLVMEHLEGETLAARLARGPLGVHEALQVAIPIADALDQAHRRGVVHRDLKPANVMLTATGPKLLDFGIAKTVGAPGSGAAGQPHAPGAAARTGLPTTPLTVPGLVIGTLQYMAPEQIEGMDADARTDIFAFGAVLHETVTGRKAFEGKTQVLLISAIATSDPPALSAVQPAVPPALDRVVQACLAKDPADRWQTARDLLAALRWIAGGGAAERATVPALAVPVRRGRLARALLAAAAGAALLMAVPAARYAAGDARAPAELRYQVAIQPLVYTPSHPDGHAAISPDGTRLAFLARSFRAGTGQGTEDLLASMAIHVGRVGTLSVERLPGTEGAAQPFWSADGRSLGFFAGGAIMRVDLQGGRPQRVAAAPGFAGGDWNGDGTIVFGSPTGIHQVSAEGGTPDAVTAPGESESGHFWPRFLPDGRRFLYLAWSGDAAGRAVMAGSLDAAAGSVHVMPGESNAVYARPAGTGYLAFARGSAVFVQPFDEQALRTTGAAVRFADDVGYQAGNGRSRFDMSANGVLAYYSDRAEVALLGGAGFEGSSWQPVWVNPSSGAVIERVGPPGVWRGVEVSPDGTRVALHRHDETGGDVWVVEPQGTLTRLTFDPARDNSMPVWSPDGAEIAFSARRDGVWGLYRTRSDGSTDASLLHESDRPLAATSWSSDGQIVFWTEAPRGRGDLWMLAIGEASGGADAADPQALVTSPADEVHGQVSPDGRWLAYASDATERGVYHVYVRPFPTGAGRWQVSTEPGFQPRWSRDGRTLFFKAAIADAVTPRGVLMASRVSTRDAAFVHDPPRPIVAYPTLNMAHAGGPYSAYGVSPDPARLLVFQLTGVGGGAETTALTILQAVGADTDVGMFIARHWDTAFR